MKVTTKTVQDRITILQNLKTISLSEEFTLNVFRWALVQQERAQAAEAKLAELEKQEPVAEVNHDGTFYGFKALENMPEGNYPLFTRPAPVVSLTPVSNCLSFFASVIKSGESWSATCQRDLDAARETLRNIEACELDAKRVDFIQSLAEDPALTAPDKNFNLGHSEPTDFRPSGLICTSDSSHIAQVSAAIRAEDPALLSGKSGLLKYRFDQHWFAVDGCRETATHYVARLRENGVVTHYAKSLYDFRPEENTDGTID